MPKPSKPTPFVIAYDFDGTLASGNMQEYDFIPELGMESHEFWEKVGDLAKTQDADPILSYMQHMLHEAEIKKIPVRKSNFEEYGKKIHFFKGVEAWFARINAYAKSHNVNVEHFIISSGLREMIEGTSIAKEFTKIFASGFMYDHHDVAIWPALAVNYTTKTQYLFRINKGSLEVHDNTVINKYVHHAERPVPFENMVFIGDGETDIPCMRLVREYGGHSIAMFEEDKEKAKKSAELLVKEGRVTLSAVADYSEGSVIDKAIKAMIDKVAAVSRIDFK